MKFTQKFVAKMMLIVAIGLILLLLLQQPTRCEAFQDAAQEGIVEIPIPAKDLENQIFTVPIPQGMESKHLTNIYFKLWDPAKMAWGEMKDGSTLPKTYDQGGTTLTFESGSMMIRKQGARGLLKTHKALPVAVNQLDKGGITIKNIVAGNLGGTLPSSGDPSGAKVAVGLVFNTNPVASAAAGEKAAASRPRARPPPPK